jgi:hypothetical protein
MQDLRVIGVENGALLVASDDGTRYRIAIDEVLQSKLRKSIPDPGAGRKLAPKEIQAHIRSGMSAQDVASITGVPIEYIQKFEGPVLAEREFVVESALSVPVHTAIESDPMSQGTTFGSAIRERLYGLGAINERWASWKEVGGGWIVKLAFTAEQIDHDARWQYDPKKAALAPLNGEAITLSQQGDMTGALIPRLRAVVGEERVADASRFDSGAFSENDLSGHPSIPRGETSTLTRPSESSPAVAAAAINREPADAVADSHETANLLEALRRRRGERETAHFEEDPLDQPRSSGDGIRLIDIPLDGYSDQPLSFERDESPGNTAPQPTALQPKVRKGRAAMPSWDDIVFGARPDDDPA